MPTSSRGYDAAVPDEVRRRNIPSPLEKGDRFSGGWGFCRAVQWYPTPLHPSVILSDRRESKDLPAELIANLNIMRSNTFPSGEGGTAQPWRMRYSCHITVCAMTPILPFAFCIPAPYLGVEKHRNIQNMYIIFLKWELYRNFYENCGWLYQNYLVK